MVDIRPGQLWRFCPPQDDFDYGGMDELDLVICVNDKFVEVVSIDIDKSHTNKHTEMYPMKISEFEEHVKMKRYTLIEKRYRLITCKNAKVLDTM